MDKSPGCAFGFGLRVYNLLPVENAARQVLGKLPGSWPQPNDPLNVALFGLPLSYSDRDLVMAAQGRPHWMGKRKTRVF